MLAKLLPLIPEGGRPYVEPYFGGGSVFFARAPAPVEVINDIDGDIVHTLRVLQDREQFDELKHRLMWTPYARDEFARAIEIRRNPSAQGIDRAWAVIVSQNFSVNGNHKTIGNWSRVFVCRGGMADVTNKWLMRLSMLDAWHWRLMRAQIDNRDALDVIRYWDCEDAVIYCDPPYVHDTRSPGSRNVYACEQDDAHHQALVETLLSIRGTVVLSGYDHPIYQPLEDAGWCKIQFQTSAYTAGRTRSSRLQGKGSATAAVPRTEVVWTNKPHHPSTTKLLF
jgi:DNA adenine methylase